MRGSQTRAPVRNWSRDCKRMLFTGCSHGLLSLLSHTVQDHLPRGGPIHNGPSPPTSMAKKENAPIDLSIRQSDGGMFSTESSSSQMTLACVKLAKATQLDIGYLSCHSEKSLGNFCIFSRIYRNLVLVWCLSRVGSKESNTSPNVTSQMKRCLASETCNSDTYNRTVIVLQEIQGCVQDWLEHIRSPSQWTLSIAYYIWKREAGGESKWLSNPPPPKAYVKGQHFCNAVHFSCKLPFDLICTWWHMHSHVCINMHERTP